MMHRGRVAFSAALDDIKESHHRLTLRFAEARPGPPALAGALSWQGEGHEWTAVCNGRLAELQAAAAAAGARVVDKGVPSLDEIFVARVGS
jgi:ABC-2 type transport system ATP-binding protein